MAGSNVRYSVSPHSALDDGSPPEHWSDTAMKQEFSKVYSAFMKWKREHSDEFPGEAFKSIVRIGENVLEELDMQMSGDL